MTKKIAIICPYFGKWPYWIDLYFQSCKFNKGVDFCFFTDCEIKEAYKAENIRFFQLSFQEYCQKVSDRLGISFCPDNPYKLCDLKPFYGYVHEDLLVTYDFWGFGDLDLVWGDIKKFCADKILDSKDVFSTHADRVSGHFALIRNTEHYRELCFRIPSWQNKLEDRGHYALDEIDYSVLLYGKIVRVLWKIHSRLLKMNGIDEWKVYQRILKVANALFKPKKLYFMEQDTTPFPDAIDRKAVRFRYEHGKLTNEISNKEIVYLHFLCLKKKWNESNYCVSNDSSSIVFTTEGIFSNENK